MKIIELKSSNIKRLKAVEFTIDESQNIVLITGKNAQGKSSVLDSIWYALGGRKANQDKPIRDGQDKAEVELTIQSEKGNYIVKRTFTEKGSYLSVTNTEGAKYSNPQELLDFIVGNLSFDPLEFSRMDNKKKIAELTRVVGLDFSKIEQEKKELTEERLLVGREQKSLPSYSDDDKKFIDEYSKKDEISVSELSSKLEKESAISSEYTHSQTKIDTEKTYIKETEKKIKELQKNIEDAKARIEEFKKIKDTKEDLDAIRKEIDSADEINSKIRKAKDMAESLKKSEDKVNEYKSLTDKIKAIDEDKAKKLSESKMPIDGLSWNEDKVLFNDIPYEQISSAEQLKVSMAIAMATNPKLRMLQIRDGSLLDKDNLKVIQGMTKDKDFQAFIEKVDDSSKVGIVIEDGVIKKNYNK